MTAKQTFNQGMQVVLKDIAQGFFEITHNGFALLGLAVMFACITLVASPDMRQEGEVKLISWLQDRQDGDTDAELDLYDHRSDSITPAALTKEQAAVANWLSKKYNVAYDPMRALVAEVYSTGKNNRLDPALILAVMAIESRFNPYAQSSAGAQGLMQVMTRVHVEKFQLFGGHEAALDPDANMRVGSLILREYIAKGGSLNAGLRLYVGASSIFISDGGYGEKVLAERSRLRHAAALRVASLGQSLY